MEITGGGLPEAVYGVYLTENADLIFDVRPILGRNIEPSDAENGRHASLVLNYRFWQPSLIIVDPNVIGKSLELDHASYTIVTRSCRTWFCIQ